MEEVIAFPVHMGAHDIEGDADAGHAKGRREDGVGKSLHGGEVHVPAFGQDPIHQHDIDTVGGERRPQDIPVLKGKVWMTRSCGCDHVRCKIKSLIPQLAECAALMEMVDQKAGAAAEIKKFRLSLGTGVQDAQKNIKSDSEVLRIRPVHTLGGWSVSAQGLSVVLDEAFAHTIGTHHGWLE